MNIFFAGAIRGGRAHQPKYADIVRILEQYGAVFSAHVADETVTAYGETDITAKEIHDRELASLAKSELMVAEVTTPSLGVGYLIARAEQLKKPITCLFFGDDLDMLSAMIKGTDGVRVRTYKTASDIEAIAAEELKTKKPLS